MPDSLVMPALLAIVFLPLILAVALRRRRAAWLVPGLALIVIGMFVISAAPPASGGHGGPAVFGAGLETAVGPLLACYGLACLFLAGWLHARARQRAAGAPVVELPPARTVRHVSKS
jgi:hypothetical protein